ncbi:MAG: hypothetical protein ACLGHP_09895, partial [Vicinamibacteria bacterium]
MAPYFPAQPGRRAAGRARAPTGCDAQPAARGSAAYGIGIALGLALGLAAAASRGLLDEAVMRLSDFAFAFPAVLSAIMITAAWGPGAVNA